MNGPTKIVINQTMRVPLSRIAQATRLSPVIVSWSQRSMVHTVGLRSPTYSSEIRRLMQSNEFISVKQSYLSTC